MFEIVFGIKTVHFFGEWRQGFSRNKKIGNQKNNTHLECPHQSQYPTVHLSAEKRIQTMCINGVDHSKKSGPIKNKIQMQTGFTGTRKTFQYNGNINDPRKIPSHESRKNDQRNIFFLIAHFHQFGDIARGKSQYQTKRTRYQSIQINDGNYHDEKGVGNGQAVGNGGHKKVGGNYVARGGAAGGGVVEVGGHLKVIEIKLSKFYFSITNFPK